MAAVLSASTLAGDKVKNPKGEDLGKIEELNEACPKRNDRVGDAAALKIDESSGCPWSAAGKVGRQ